jgi:hypothetical protein
MRDASLEGLGIIYSVCFDHIRSSHFKLLEVKAKFWEESPNLFLVLLNYEIRSLNFVQ